MKLTKIFSSIHSLIWQILFLLMASFIALLIPFPFGIAVLVILSLTMLIESHIRNRSELKKLSLLSQNLELLKIGELTNYIDSKNLNTNNLIDSLMLEYNTTIEYLNAVITNIVESTNLLHNTIHQIIQNSKDLDNSSFEQASLSSNVATNVEQSTTNISSIVVFSDHTTNTLNTLFDEIKVLSSHINESKKFSIQSTIFIQEISDEVNDGNRSLVELNDKMNKIINSSSQIKRITEIIKDISEKINLLSLNASIEAARAGEYGRGFAVVAQEVSKLADQTAASIKNVDTLIKKNNSEINSGMNAIQYTTAKFSKITNIISMISTIVQNISSSMERQVDVNLKVNTGIESLHQNYQKINSLLIDQQKANIEISKLIKDVYNLSLQNSDKAKNSFHKLSSTMEIIENLKIIMDLFKIK